MLSLSFLVCQSVTASASPVQSPESDKLIRDVDHLVQVAEQTNWHIDTEELKSLRTDILLVLCPASDALRQESLRVLNERVARHGDLKEQYALANQELAAIRLPLRHHRSLLLFKSGLDRAKIAHSGWLKPLRTQNVTAQLNSSCSGLTEVACLT